MNQNILLNKSEGEGNACFFSNLNKNGTKYFENNLYYFIYFEIHDKIFNVYNQYYTNCIHDYCIVD